MWCMGLVASWHERSSRTRDLLHWQVDSLPLSRQGNRGVNVLFNEYSLAVWEDLKILETYRGDGCTQREYTI